MITSQRCKRLVTAGDILLDFARMEIPSPPEAPCGNRNEASA